jgi:hypothetical protein
MEPLARSCTSADGTGIVNPLLQIPVSLDEPDRIAMPGIPAGVSPG